MSIAMINPEPPQPKGKFLVIDQLFYFTITRKYGRFKQSRLKYPTLIFFFGPRLQLPVLQYLLVKNMTLPPGNRTGASYHLEPHLDFVISLFLRLTHLAPTPAAPAPAPSAAL